MNNTQDNLDIPADFSLVLGGPLYQLYLRTRVCTPPLELLHRRIVGFTVVAWLPLLLLTLLAGGGTSGAGVPFLVDLDSHARLLVALPLLVAAELIVHQRIRPVVLQFLQRDILATEARPRFEAIVASAMRLRNSVIAEVLMILLVFTIGYWAWREHATLTVATWYSAEINGHSQLTLPGYWYAFVSLPIVRFILARWYFRLFIWYRFLWQVSRLPLRLNSLHPDRACGLGFLAGSVFAFAPVLLAHSVFLSGLIGNRIWHEAARLPDFKLDIAALMAFLLALVLAPLCFFIFHLSHARRTANREYGILASRYVADFRRKWIEAGTSEQQDELLIGSADIQSLADLANSFDVVRETRLVPFGKETILRLAIITALPLFPLTLTMIPLDEMIDRFLGILL